MYKECTKNMKCVVYKMNIWTYHFWIFCRDIQTSFLHYTFKALYHHHHHHHR